MGLYSSPSLFPLHPTLQSAQILFPFSSLSSPPRLVVSFCFPLAWMKMIQNLSLHPKDYLVVPFAVAFPPTAAENVTIFSPTATFFLDAL